MDKKIGEDSASYPCSKAKDNDEGIELVLFDVSKRNSQKISIHDSLLNFRDTLTELKTITMNSIKQKLCQTDLSKGSSKKQ
jgi:hypothetical protein